MTVSRPKKSTLFSLALFLIITYGGGLWSALVVPSTPAFWYLIPILCLSTGLVITIKVLIGYRTLSIKGDRWMVKKLVGKDFQFKTREIVWWKIIEIKTGGGQYRELQIASPSGVVKTSFQEHTEYQTIFKLVRSKCPRKQVKEPE